MDRGAPGRPVPRVRGHTRQAEGPEGLGSKFRGTLSHVGPFRRDLNARGRNLDGARPCRPRDSMALPRKLASLLTMYF